MLYADKAALENRTKLRLLAIRERELALYTKNCITIGTVSALMAGLAYSSLLYATKRAYYQDASAVIQIMYVMGNVTSMYLALRAMTGTTMIAMFGPGKVHASALPMWWSSLGGCGGGGGDGTCQLAAASLARWRWYYLMLAAVIEAYGGSHLGPAPRASPRAPRS